MAISKHRKCPTCLGRGVCDDGSICPLCAGIGEVEYNQMPLFPQEPCWDPT
jgi:DnaJ-class molecular chaperone